MNKKKLTLKEGSNDRLAMAIPRPVNKLEDEAKDAKWDDGLFQKWIDLRTKLKKNKMEKDWRAEINVCEEIIQLDSQAKFINIMIPLFYRDMAKAYEKLEDRDNTLRYYLLAKEGLLKYRNERKLSGSDDWLSDINSIDEKISQLSATDAEG